MLTLCKPRFTPVIPRRAALRAGAGVPRLANAAFTPAGARDRRSPETLLLLPDHAAGPEAVRGALPQPPPATGGGQGDTAGEGEGRGVSR